MRESVRSPSPELLREQLETAATFIGPKTSLVSFAVDSPAFAASKLIRALPDQPFFAYDGAAGLGVAAELRLDRLDAAAAKTWALGVLDAEAIGGRVRPPIFCGAAFAPRATGEGRWRDFPPFYLVVPRWSYQADRGHATLTLTLPAVDALDPGCQEQALRENRHLIACLEATPAAVGPPPELGPVAQMTLAAWEAMVGDALGEIASGRFRKLVLARTATVQASEDWSDLAVFQRLIAGEGKDFAVRFGSTTFLGCTPERLVEGGNQGFKTLALAGTLPASADETALLRSPKNREEHQLVVAEILRRLQPLSSDLQAAAAPAAVHLKDVLHLRTPISGRPREGVHLLDLACALHPTPAVGGLPSDQAIDWICTHEPEPRGWYAGFVGWFNHCGDGEMSVTIRSGLLSGPEACLYAGAGIVAGSEPAAEYRETAWKQRPFLRALGIDLPA